MTAEEKSPLERRLDRLTRGLALFGAGVLLAYAGAVVVDALLRWIPGVSLLGLSDIGTLVLPPSLASFLPALFWQRGNIGVSLVGRALGGRSAAGLDLFGDAAALLFLLLLCAGYAAYARDLDGRHSVILEWPLAPTAWAATAILILAAIVQAVALLARLRHGVRRGAG